MTADAHNCENIWLDPVENYPESWIWKVIRKDHLHTPKCGRPACLVGGGSLCSWTRQGWVCRKRVVRSNDSLPLPKLGDDPRSSFWKPVGSLPAFASLSQRSLRGRADCVYLDTANRVLLLRVRKQKLHAQLCHHSVPLRPHFPPFLVKRSGLVSSQEKDIRIST